MKTLSLAAALLALAGPALAQAQTDHQHHPPMRHRLLRCRLKPKPLRRLSHRARCLRGR